MVYKATMIALLILMFIPSAIGGKENCVVICLTEQCRNDTMCLECPTGTSRDINGHREMKRIPPTERLDGREYWELKVKGNTTLDNNLGDCLKGYNNNQMQPPKVNNLYNGSDPFVPTATTESPGYELINVTTCTGYKKKCPCDDAAFFGLCVGLLTGMVIMVGPCYYMSQKQSTKNGGSGESESNMEESRCERGDAQSQPMVPLGNRVMDRHEGILSSRVHCGFGRCCRANVKDRPYRHIDLRVGLIDGTVGKIDRGQDGQIDIDWGQDGQIDGRQIDRRQDRLSDGCQYKPFIENVPSGCTENRNNIQSTTEKRNSSSLEGRPIETDKIQGATAAACARNQPIVEYPKRENGATGNEQKMKKEQHHADERVELERIDYTRLCDIIDRKSDGELVVVYKLCFGEGKQDVTVDDFNSAMKEWAVSNQNGDVLQLLRKRLDHEHKYSYIFKSREYILEEEKIWREKEKPKKTVGELHTDDNITPAIFHLIYNRCEDSEVFLNLLETSMKMKFPKLIADFKMQKFAGQGEAGFLHCARKWVLFNPEENHKERIVTALRKMNQNALIEELRELKEF